MREINKGGSCVQCAKICAPLSLSTHNERRGECILKVRRTRGTCEWNSSVCVCVCGAWDQFFFCAYWISARTMTASIHATSLVKYFYLLHHSSPKCVPGRLFSARRRLAYMCGLFLRLLQREIPAFWQANIEPSALERDVLAVWKALCQHAREMCVCLFKLLKRHVQVVVRMH